MSYVREHTVPFPISICNNSTKQDITKCLFARRSVHTTANMTMLTTDQHLAVRTVVAKCLGDIIKDANRCTIRCLPLLVANA